MKISLPKLSLVVLIGPSGAGKSTFAKAHFLPTEVLSSDVCRGIVSDDQNSQAATSDAFELLNFIAAKRLANGHLTVIDATNVQKESRRPFIRLAKQFHVLPIAIVLNVPETLCQARNQNRHDRNFGPHVVRQQSSQLRRSIKRLKQEGFRHIHVLNSADEVAAVTVERVRLWTDKSDESGPFDVIGDVHGCADELQELLDKLGYQTCLPATDDPGWSAVNYVHPENRRAIFVGDLVDRGPKSLDVLSIVRNMVLQGSAFCVPGNHDDKLLKKLRGKNVKMSYGIQETLADLATVPDEHQQSFTKQLIHFLDGLISHHVFDDGRLVVAHAGVTEEMHGRASGQIRAFAMYGDTTGETDQFGMPVRRNWAANYRGAAQVVYGHTPVAEAEWLNNTLNIDTGCVFGGKLTALRYPEQEVIAVKAVRQYCEPGRPFLPPARSSTLDAQQQHDDLLDAADVMGKRIIETKLQHSVTIREENSTAAMEIMSRFAVNPKWLIYLPPTMSPCETSRQTHFLEHPDQAFDYFRSQQVLQVVCQEKHMGSRAVVIVCKDADAARQRFGVTEGEAGIIYTRTGRPFFNDGNLESQILSRLSNAMLATGFWDRFHTSWACFDCELMPWSAKAQELLKSQYAAVAAAGRAALPPVIDALQQTKQRLASKDSLGDLKNFLSQATSTADNLDRFTTAYRQYCWNVESIDDFQLAAFHVLATEGTVHADKDHVWHMQEVSKICSADSGLLLPTTNRIVNLGSSADVAAAVDWWTQITAAGGEGMVVKPLNFITRNGNKLVQPAMKCRGSEYLRIIYGPDYDSEKNLNRLRRRNTGRKRSLALREFALGIEGLERFINHQPLRKIHECAFGVLALESEPVDPRL
ncbi:MAG: polynucleotide kinase-phosphatase [Fuerstiella sp.]